MKKKEKNMKIDDRFLFIIVTCTVIHIINKISLTYPALMGLYVTLYPF